MADRPECEFQDHVFRVLPLCSLMKATVLELSDGVLAIENFSIKRITFQNIDKIPPPKSYALRGYPRVHPSHDCGGKKFLNFGIASEIKHTRTILALYLYVDTLDGAVAKFISTPHIARGLNFISLGVKLNKLLTISGSTTKY